MKIQNAIGIRGRYLLTTFASILALETLFRILFFALFFKTAHKADSSDFLFSFYLGLKFDTRIAIALCLPIALFPWWMEPFSTQRRLRLWSSFYALFVSLLVAIYLIDFGYYSYLQGRFNATILRFFENFWISAEMVWQTYPVIPGLFLVIAMYTATFLYFYKIVFKKIEAQRLSRQRQILVILGGALAIAAGGHAKLSQYPLRWSEAFFSTDPFVSSLALNPLHYFFDTLSYREVSYDTEKVKKYYPAMAAYLGVENPDIKTLTFERPIHLTPLPGVAEDHPNVVFFIMESFAAYKTGFLGHPMNPTPHFDKIARDSLLFTRFYVPSEGTARSVFGYVSGVPDVTRSKTSSRNPLIVDQNTIVNAFTDYDKYYFIGGSANWGNIRGVLSNNISGMQIIEEGMFRHPRTDVWGLADLHLFEEAHERLASRSEPRKPFFAFIQSAGFHRPYTIPEDHETFELKNLSDKDLAHSGFISNAEYNSMRFADYSLGRFFELARKAPYFKNTIFVIVGDHGLPDDGADHVAPPEKLHLLSRFHVPLTFYSPKYWPKGELNDTIATSPDVLPTLAGLLGRPFQNTAMGRNLFDPQFKNSRNAFTYVYYQTPPEIGLLTPRFYTSGTPGNVDQLFDMTSTDPAKPVQDQFPQDFARLRDLTDGWHETAKYLLYHNPKKGRVSLQATGSFQEKK